MFSSLGGRVGKGKAKIVIAHNWHIPLFHWMACTAQSLINGGISCRIFVEIWHQ